MKTVEETRRQLFEKLLEDQANLDKLEDDPEIYEAQYVRNYWYAFNLALDSIEIELPKGDSNMSAGTLHIIARCHGSINSLNLGIKVK